MSAKPRPFRIEPDRALLEAMSPEERGRYLAAYLPPVWWSGPWPPSERQLPHYYRSCERVEAVLRMPSGLDRVARTLLSPLADLVYASDPPAPNRTWSLTGSRLCGSGD